MADKVNITTFSAFLLHLHPRKVHPETLRFGLSFGLGGMAVTLVGTLFLSGILQLISYQPQTVNAYRSILQMYGAGEVSGFVRNIHHWSGNLLVIVVFFHMMRVFLTGALTEERRFNWLVGIVLFLSILFSNFTGYLLPWDQLAYWAVTIFTSMASYIPFIGQALVEILRGGTEVGQATLSIFFAIHVSILPVIVVLFSAWHFWLIRKAGGLIITSDAAPKPAKITTLPHLISREVVVGFGLLALIMVFSALVDAPLDVEANPGESPNPAKAAWYFLGFQELLLHLHPLFAICIVPLCLLSGGAAIVYLKNTALPGGVWFGGRNRGRYMAFWSVLLGVLLVSLLVAVDDFFLTGVATVEK